MMKHTQEPLKVEKIEGSFDDGWEVQLIPATGPDSDWHSFVVAFGFGDPDYREIAEANARRIVACVNALAGIENPAEFIAAIRAETLKEAADSAVAWVYANPDCEDAIALRAAIMEEPK